MLAGMVAVESRRPAGWRRVAISLASRVWSVVEPSAARTSTFFDGEGGAAEIFEFEFVDEVGAGVGAGEWDGGVLDGCSISGVIFSGDWADEKVGRSSASVKVARIFAVRRIFFSCGV